MVIGRLIIFNIRGFCRILKIDYHIVLPFHQDCSLHNRVDLILTKKKGKGSLMYYSKKLWEVINGFVGGIPFPTLASSHDNGCKSLEFYHNS